MARVKCRAPGKDTLLPPGTLELLIVPAALDGLQVGDLTKLYLDPELVKTIDKHLDQFRLLTTNLRIREPRYVGVKVLVEIVVAEYNQPAIVQARVIKSLKNFISPLDATSLGATSSDIMGPDWEGWPFGRALFVSEIYALIQKIPGVKHVLDVQSSWRTVIPAREKMSSTAEDDNPAERAERGPLAQRRSKETGYSGRCAVVLAGTRSQDYRTMIDQSDNPPPSPALTIAHAD